MLAAAGKKVVSGLPGAVVGLVVTMPPLLKALIILQLIDLITGTLVAWSGGAISSDASRRGLVKKATALLLIAAVEVVSNADVGNLAPFGIHLASFVAGWFCWTEVISIAENAGRAGWTLPHGLKQALATVRAHYETPGNNRHAKID